LIDKAAAGVANKKGGATGVSPWAPLFMYSSKAIFGIIINYFFVSFEAYTFVP
jgi:hypothetical protein